MPNFCRAIVVGHLTKDPELRYIPNGSAVCDFSVAVNRNWTDKAGKKNEKVSFFDCIAWAKTAELLAQYMKKGGAILIDGYLEQDRWEDKESGQKRSKVKVVAERIQFLGGKRDEDAAASAPASEEGQDVPF